MGEVKSLVTAWCSFFLHLLIRAPGSYQELQQDGALLLFVEFVTLKIIGAIQAISNLGANDLKIETLLITCWFQRLNSCFLSPANHIAGHEFKSGQDVTSH